MHIQSSPPRSARAALILISVLCGSLTVMGQQPVKTDPAVAAPSAPAPTPEAGEDGMVPVSSVEQGQTPLSEAYELDRRQWRLKERREALKDTEFKFNVRTYYFDRNKYDGSESESLAIGGSLGFKTGYFLDHIAFAATGYTSQHLYGDDDKDGALLLEPGQEGYTVLGEAYADIRFIDDLNLYVGRKEFDTPFINRNDTRMTPNSFEAIVLQGRAKLDDEGATLKYGLGYFHSIKERNSDDFVSMSEDAGADAERGVFTAGALYQKGGFSFGGIDYYCPDTINIAYVEAKTEIPISEDWKPRIALQFTDQRSVGDNLLQEDDFSVQQYGIKAELPFGNALFTAAYTHTADGANMQSPWSGYPGYTSVQVEDFNRAGEKAVLLRAGYEFPWAEGLSAYALWVHGLDPEDPTQYAKDECNFNVQWAPSKGVLKGLALRVRYGVVEQHGGDVEDLTDLRVICNYTINF